MPEPQISKGTTERAMAAFRAGAALDVRPEPAEPARLGIGVVGAGDIVDTAHLPSYAAAGFRVAAITSRTAAGAKRLAARHGIPRVHPTLDALLSDAEVDVVDVAVPPQTQPDIVHAALDAGKHVLAQKPLALSFREAVSMVEHAERSGLTLAVNQNGRYDPFVNAARGLVRQGLLGTRLVAALSMHIETVWQDYLKDPSHQRLMILNMSIHHIDQLIWLFGAPTAVTAIARTAPGPYPGERIAQYALHYDDGFWATSLDDGMNWASDFSITYRIHGTDAVLLGEVGFPHGRPSELRYQLRGREDWVRPSFLRQWFPDAFSSTMGELLLALEQGREPTNSGRDNLTTLRAVFAAYRSVTEQRRVALSEVSTESD